MERQPDDQPAPLVADGLKQPSVGSSTASWSPRSERQHGSLSDLDPSDRVFPIRSVVSVNPSGRPAPEQSYFPHPPDPRLPDHDSVATPSAATVLRPPLPRAHTSVEAIIREPSPAQPLPQLQETTGGPLAQERRKHKTDGPMSSIQADATRHRTPATLSLFSDSASVASQESATATDSRRPEAGLEPSGQTEAEDPTLLTTLRFKHVMTEEGHAVITGRDGTLQRCEDEPIHAPGAIQAYGVLLTLREEQEGRFIVRYVSENCSRMFNYTPQQLFKLESFLDILTDEQQDNLLDHIDFIRDEDADPAVNGPEVFSVSVRPPGKRTIKLWCALHINPVHPDLIICEFELDNDHEFPLRPPDELTPDVPEDTLQSNPTLEELTESTEILSRPLRVLRSARKRRGESGAMQVFDIMSQVQEQLAAAPDLEKFLKILVGIVKELTGFHRVMIYQFDSSFNGKVVTELVDTVHTRDLYKGLHFPASDIPKQARELYKLNKVRLLYDRDLESARLVCRSQEDLDVPLDMSHSYLRAMSPIHLKYLANMAVRSSMSISINAFNELWGLIACHSYGQRGMRVSFPIRKMCRVVGDTASRNIERLSYASRLQARKLINTSPTDKNPSGYIIASSEDLLKLFDADSGLLSIRGETKILGRIQQSQEALAMLEYLRLRKLTSVVTCQDIKEDFPDLQYAPGFQVIAGLLYVPLSAGGNDFIVFFRRGQVKEVKWAGNPYEKVVREGTSSYLEPRKSFRTWNETVMGKCRDWTEEQVETAAVLCLVYGKFIEVWRQKEAALQSSRFTRLLLANSAHEVRTPLNAIINYLEIALEGSLDQETRDNLAKSHSASKSLIYVINDLLDLTMTEEGQELVKDEMFELSSCIREATEPFRIDASRKGIGYEVFEHPGLPRYVYGDSRRLRQAVANVTANAVQHTETGCVKVELYVTEILEQKVRIEILVQDTGKGMNVQELDALFRDLEQVSSDVDVDDDKFAQQTEDLSSENRTLGLGLAVVARFVRNADGQLRLRSEEGKGSRFIMQLPFDLPPGTPDSDADPDQDNSTKASSLVSITTALPPVDENEVLLIDRNRDVAGLSGRTLHRSVSYDASSIGSKTSGRSNVSDADRLIDALQTSLSLVEGQKSELSRPKSSGSVQAIPGRSPSVSSKHYSVPGTPANLSTIAQRAVASVTADSPIKAIKMPDEDYFSQNRTTQAEPLSSASQYEAPKSTTSLDNVPESSASVPSVSANDAKLHVLVAEDDPINLRVLRKRLEKAGHEVYHAVNGADCARMYQERCAELDVILMDMQMPILDGLSSTRLIRKDEKSDKHGGFSDIGARNGRIPIFAVSASLFERDKDTYIGAGFDGWILKPIDFKRLNTLLTGLEDDEARNECLYSPGQWGRGGWFSSRSDPESSTTPSEATPRLGQIEA